MTRSVRQLVAGVQLAGPVLGLLYVRKPTITGPVWVAIVTFAVFIGFLGALAVGGILLLRDHPWGLPMSLTLQAIQVLQVTTTPLTLALHGPLAITIGVAGDGGILANIDLSTTFAFALGKTPDQTSVAINLFAAVLLYLLLRTPRLKEAGVSRGVIVR